MTTLSPYADGERLYGNITDQELGYYEGEEVDESEIDSLECAERYFNNITKQK